MIQKFFEIFNFRFWLFIFELSYFPLGLIIGGSIYRFIEKKKGSTDED